MELAISILHVLVCIFLVLTILLQAGKGASVGAAFGGAGSQTVFGGRGAQTFLSKLTTAAAAIFFITSLALSYASTAGGTGSLLEGETAAPAAAPAPTTGEAKPETPPTTRAPADAGGAQPEAVEPAPEAAEPAPAAE
ncbi:preprotein translocase subunit SecG [Vulgatibacter sp.]|uniref:preprotein translocase subunit SecG n=1 Tax=Vulgatibacter sp. TaxID=1971226 RepID=UPI003562BEE6